MHSLFWAIFRCLVPTYKTTENDEIWQNLLILFHTITKKASLSNRCLCQLQQFFESQLFVFVISLSKKIFFLETKKFYVFYAF